MTAFSLALLIAAVALGAWLGWRSWVRPLFDLRDALRAVAQRRDHHPIVRSTLQPFTDMASDIGRVQAMIFEQERQLADEGFSLRAILGSMVEGIVIVDPALRIRLANDALYAMFDLTRSPINRTVIEVFRDHELSEAIGRSIREIRALNLDIQRDVRRSEGRPERHFRVNVAPLLPAGGSKPVGTLLVFNDVTEVRTLETVRREFVANVSHEFRTPLAIITGYVETLLDGAIEDREMTKRSLEIMQKHGKRLNLLIDDLLTISQMEHRSVALQFRNADLAEILQRVIEQLESSIKETHAMINVSFETDARIAEVDPPRIEQVFFNLLSNALRYGIRDQADVRISGRRRGDEIEIAVSDNGPGIPYEDQPHIFERFYRVRKDRSRDAGGTGLGLSIVKNVAMAHGGHVSLRSTPGAGATFKIVLPVVQNGA